MKKSFLFFLLVTLIGTTYSFAQSNTSKADAILGVWTNPARDAKFEIYKKDKKYYGKIIWGTGRDTKDISNPDPKLRKRELIGLTILNNFVYEEDNVWDDGTIYDPKEGKTYSCVMVLSSPNKLDVRGYIGLSLFGRTETWTRVKQ